MGVFECWDYVVSIEYYVRKKHFHEIHFTVKSKSIWLDKIRNGGSSENTQDIKVYDKCKSMWDRSNYIRFLYVNICVKNGCICVLRLCSNYRVLCICMKEI